MGHGKLRKFAENETFPCLLQPSAGDVLVRVEGSRALNLRKHPVAGHWNSDVFHRDGPLVLELGCGKGDYTIALAKRHPGMNFIGVDIKGARLWKGAKYATENALPGVAFLRTRIEFIEAFFAPGEVSEIWLTFSDPQMGSENSRLSSPIFLERYRKFLSPGGIVHLKTDSRFLYEYTSAVIAENHLPVLARGTDIYGVGIEFSGDVSDPAAVTQVQTFYESMFLKMGLPITYLAFRLFPDGPSGAAAPLLGPASFDAAFWKAAEGPRRTFSHQPSPSGAGTDGTC